RLAQPPGSQLDPGGAPMTTTTPSAALIPAAPVFTNSERLALDRSANWLRQVISNRLGTWGEGACPGLAAVLGAGCGITWRRRRGGCRPGRAGRTPGVRNGSYVVRSPG